MMSMMVPPRKRANPRSSRRVTASREASARKFMDDLVDDLTLDVRMSCGPVFPSDIAAGSDEMLDGTILDAIDCSIKEEQPPAKRRRLFKSAELESDPERIKRITEAAKKRTAEIERAVQLSYTMWTVVLPKLDCAGEDQAVEIPDDKSGTSADGTVLPMRVPAELLVRVGIIFGPLRRLILSTIAAAEKFRRVLIPGFRLEPARDAMMEACSLQDARMVSDIITTVPQISRFVHDPVIVSLTMPRPTRIAGFARCVMTAEDGQLALADTLRKEFKIQRSDVNFHMRALRFDACRRGHIEKFRWMCEHFPIREEDVKTMERNGYPQLLACCEGGHLELLKELLNMIGEAAGTNTMRVGTRRIDLRTRNGMCMLRRDHRMREPLFVAACVGGHIEMMKWFDRTFDIGYKERRRALLESCQAASIGSIKWLLDAFRFRDGDIWCNDGELFTALCGNGLLDFASSILERFPRPLKFSENCIVLALEASCRHGQRDVIEWLFDEYPSLVHDKRTGSALAACCGGGHLDMAKWIYAKLRKVSAFTMRAGFRAACNSGKLDVIKWLGGHEICPSPETHVAYYDEPEDRRASNNYDALVAGLRDACAEGHRAVVDWLITTYRFFPSDVFDGVSGPFWFAVQRGRPEVAGIVADRYQIYSADDLRRTGLVVHTDADEQTAGMEDYDPMGHRLCLCYASVDPALAGWAANRLGLLTLNLARAIVRECSRALSTKGLTAIFGDFPALRNPENKDVGIAAMTEVAMRETFATETEKKACDTVRFLCRNFEIDAEDPISAQAWDALEDAQDFVTSTGDELSSLGE